MNKTHTYLIKQISNETFRSNKTDECLLKSIISRCEHVYGTSDESKSIIKRLDRNTGVEYVPVNQNYKRRDPYNYPWIDYNTYNMFLQNDANLSVPLPSNIREKDIARSLKNSIRRYTHKNRTFTKRDIRAISSAGYSAFSALNLTNDIDSKYNTTSVNFAVDTTAKDSNSGWPLFRRKNSTSCRADTRKWLDKMVNRPTVYSLFNNPVLANPSYKFNRFQITFDEVENSSSIKVREVWCVPARIVALECYFFFELVDNYKKWNSEAINPLTNSGLDDAAVGSRIVKRLRSMLSLDSKECLFSTDYSKFDSTIPDVAMDIFFNICKQHLVLNDKEAQLYDLLRFYNKKSPTVVDNELVFFMRGMSSGSYITHIFDTWWNLTLWYLTKHAMESDIVTQSEIVNSLEYKPLLSHHIYNKIFFYSTRKDIGLCGDDTIIFTTSDEILMHRNICDDFGMKVSTKRRTCDPSELCFFLGTYWNSDSKPLQTFEYMCLHIIFRTKWYERGELPFPLRDLLYHRSLSICQKFSNGWEFLRRAFGKNRGFRKFLSEHMYYYNTKEWPDESYLKPKLIIG